MELNKKNIKQILLIITFAVVLIWAVNNMAAFLGLVKSVISIFTPFIIGLCLAFIINVLMSQLEKSWNKIPSKKHKEFYEKIKRPVCLVLSLLIIIGAVFILMFMIVPQISRTVMTIVDMMPEYFEKMEQWWIELRAIMEKFAIILPEIDIDFKEITSKVSEAVSVVGPKFIDKTMNFTGSLFGGILDFVLGFVFSIYVLSQKEKLGKNVKKALRAMLPKKRVKRVFKIARISNKTFTNFITGQLTEALIIGALCFIGMVILRMPYPLAISALIAFTALIPVFGAFIGTGIGAFLILMVDPMKALWFIVFIIVLQQLEGNLIYPKVVGKSVGLPGIWVLTAVTLGSSMFGLLGMLVAVPTFSVLYTLFRQLINKKIKKKKLTLDNESA